MTNNINTSYWRIVKKKDTSWKLRREVREEARRVRVRQNNTLMAGATYNVRTLAVDANNAWGHGKDVLDKGEHFG